MRGDVPFEIIFISKAPSADVALVPYAHVAVLVVVPVLSHRIETLVAIFATVSELIEMPQHVFLDVLLVHERPEAEIADRTVGVFGDVVVVELAVFSETRRTDVAVVDEAFTFFDVSKENELIDENLLASQTLVVRYLDIVGRIHVDVIGRREIRDLVPTLRLRSPRFRLREYPFACRSRRCH